MGYMLRLTEGIKAAAAYARLSQHKSKAHSMLRTTDLASALAVNGKIDR